MFDDSRVKEANEWWDKLPEEDQQKAFLAMSTKLNKNIEVGGGSYRYVLYDIFGFKPDMYVDAQIAGFMNVTNVMGYGLDVEHYEYAKKVQVNHPDGIQEFEGQIVLVKTEDDTLRIEMRPPDSV